MRYKTTQGVGKEIKRLAEPTTLVTSSDEWIAKTSMSVKLNLTTVWGKE